MGTWGIARDMAKLNEENLSKLSRKGFFAKMKERGYYKTKIKYIYKKASKEQIEQIKQEVILERETSKKLVLKVALSIFIPLFITIIYFLFFF